MNDAAFRRHILVQALIVLDFMLSLTPSAKTKLANSTNKSVLYGYTLGEEDVGSPGGRRMAAAAAVAAG